jgi:hypothetical protein
MHQRARLGIGYLTQEPSVFRKWTVEENLLAILETCESVEAESGPDREERRARHGCRERPMRAGGRGWQGRVWVFRREIERGDGVLVWEHDELSGDDLRAGAYDDDVIARVERHVGSDGVLRDRDRIAFDDHASSKRVAVAEDEAQFGNSVLERGSFRFCERGALVPALFGELCCAVKVLLGGRGAAGFGPASSELELWCDGFGAARGDALEHGARLYPFPSLFQGESLPAHVEQRAAGGSSVVIGAG